MGARADDDVSTERKIVIDFGKIKSPYTSAYERAVDVALRDLDRPTVLQALRTHRYGGTSSDLDLASDWLSRHRGWSFDPKRLIMSHGTLNTVDMLLSYLVGPGGTLFVEELTFHHVPWLADRLGIKVIPLSMDHEGIRPDELDEACKATTGRKALFCVPVAQNPTCATMGEKRRQAIGRISEHHGLHIIEDDAQALVVDSPRAPLAAFSGLTWWVMGLSKCIATGLRIAYIAAPNETAAQDFLAKSLLQSTWYASPLSAELFGHWLRSGDADLILAEVREEAKWRSAAARSALNGTKAVNAPGALHIWVPGEEDETQPLVDHLTTEGVSARPAKEFAARTSHNVIGARLSLTNETKGGLDKGLSILRSALVR